MAGKGNPNWKKGKSGNPNGRPVGSFSVVEAIKRKLQEINPADQRTWLESLIETIFQKSVIDKDTTMIKEMITRIDGLPVQHIDATTNGQSLNKALDEAEIETILNAYGDRRNNKGTKDSSTSQSV
jgi:hypothetical protein